MAEFFFGGKTILVEGDTEYLAFKTIINERPDDFKNVHIIRARGKAILATLMKVLNHFGEDYAVLHDADDPSITTKSGTIKKNSMWTENQKMQDIKEKSKRKIRLVASIKDFELAVFGEKSTSNKPYSAWQKLIHSPDAIEKTTSLLTALIDHDKPLPNGFLEWGSLEALELEVLPKK